MHCSTAAAGVRYSEATRTDYTRLPNEKHAPSVADGNGARAAEMRLRSYSYGAGPPSGLSVIQIGLIVAVPVAVALLLAFLWWRRRKARIQGRASPRTPPTADSHENGGNHGAR